MSFKNESNEKNTKYDKNEKKSLKIDQGLVDSERTRVTIKSKATTASSLNKLSYHNLSDIESRYQNDKESNYTAKQSILKHEQRFN